ncbi:MAG: hypothetical protein WD688_11715 [Candidatus Binatia bacterium]
MAGALWAFLSVGTIGGVMVLSEVVRTTAAVEKKKSRKWIFDVLWTVVIVFGIISIIDLGLRTLSQQRIGFMGPSHFFKFNLPTVLTYSVLFLNAGMVYGTFKAFWNIGKESEPLSAKTLFYETYRGFSPFFALVQLLGVLSIYSLFAYPYLSKEFGGGNKPTVTLIVSASLPALHLPTEKKNGSSIGPVKLLFESESMFFVTPINPEESVWGTLALGGEDTTGIAKELVQAVTYVRH